MVMVQKKGAGKLSEKDTIIMKATTMVKIHILLMKMVISKQEQRLLLITQDMMMTMMMMIIIIDAMARCEQ